MTDEDPIKIGLSEKCMSVQNARSDDAEVAGEIMLELADALALCDGNDCALARSSGIARAVVECDENGCQNQLT